MGERAEHTAGPWEIVPLSGYGGPYAIRMSYRSNNPNASKTYYGVQGIGTEANARLIAAAPDLLAALVICQKALAMMIEPKSISATSPQCAWAAAVEAETKARAAISRATGEA